MTPAMLLRTSYDECCYTPPHLPRHALYWRIIYYGVCGTDGGACYFEFAKRLWGDFWMDPETRKFKKNAPVGYKYLFVLQRCCFELLWWAVFFCNRSASSLKTFFGGQMGGGSRTFVQFILDPVYKLMSQ
eukprot:2596159-Rhodomonas_salina.1